MKGTPITLTKDQIAEIEARANALTIAPIVEKIVQDVAELPDRTSPDDQPDMMLGTAEWH